MMPLRVAWAGAVLAALICVGYDTSANVAALEGGQAHLTFARFLVFTAAGAAAGLFAGAVAGAVAASRRATREIDRTIDEP